MVKSKNYGFEVKILQKLSDDQMMGDIRNASYEALRELMTPMGPYIVALPNQEFIIELRSNDYNVYGARLFIDEQEIFYKKTFKSKGYFMGFKLGEGKFSAFKFTSPTYESQNKEGTKLVKSEIRVEFFKTTEKLVSTYSMANKSIRKAQDEYMKGSVRDNKKFFRKSLTVEAGDVLYRPGPDKATLFRKMMDEKTHKCNFNRGDSDDISRIKDNFINYDEHLETITIHYGDFNALLVLGVVSLANYEHLGVIPLSEIVEKPKIVERLLMTIIRRHNAQGINLKQIGEVFEKALRRPFVELRVGSLVSFISTRHQLFHLDDKENLRCSETAKNIYLDLRDTNPDKPPEDCIVPENYFKTGTENNLIRSKNDPRFKGFIPKPLNPSKKGNISPIVID